MIDYDDGCTTLWIYYNIIKFFISNRWSIAYVNYISIKLLLFFKGLLDSHWRKRGRERERDADVRDVREKRQPAPSARAPAADQGRAHNRVCALTANQTSNLLVTGQCFYQPIQPTRPGLNKAVLLKSCVLTCKWLCFLPLLWWTSEVFVNIPHRAVCLNWDSWASCLHGSQSWGLPMAVPPGQNQGERGAGGGRGRGDV